LITDSTLRASSSSRFCAISLRRSPIEPDATPKLFANASSSGGSVGVLTFFAGQLERRGLPGDFLAVVVLRERHVEALAFAGLHPLHRGLELGEHAALADRDREVARLAARELDAVDRAGEVDEHAVAVGGALGRVVPGRVLAAQRVDRAVDVGVGHVDLRAVDRDRGEVAERDLGIDLEHGRELERLARLGRRRVRLDARHAGDAQVLRLHRVLEARLHGLRDHVGAHLRPVLLRDHLDRHVAGPEARDLHGLREVGEAAVHFAVDVGDRNGDVEAALERGGGAGGFGHGVRRRKLRWGPACV
jgi:hypothetical protein